jgi:hypothetical protein
VERLADGEIGLQEEEMMVVGAQMWVFGVKKVV